MICSVWALSALKKMKDNGSRIVKTAMSSKCPEPGLWGGALSDMTYMASLGFISLWTLVLEKIRMPEGSIRPS